MKFLGFTLPFKDHGVPGIIPFPRIGRRPRWNRSKYQPHQGLRERLRRLKQIENGQLEMAGVDDVRKAILHFTNYGGSLRRMATREAA